MTGNSWGAINGNAVMLRSWDDEMKQTPRRVRVFVNEERPGGTTRAGRNERKGHLRGIWAGGIAAYTVIVTPKFDKKTGARNIGGFRPDAVFPIDGLVEEDGLIYAVLGVPVNVAKLPEHMQSFAATPNPGALPAALEDSNAAEPTDPAARTAYVAAAVRDYLIDAATRRTTVSYGELFDAFDLNRLTVPNVLSRIGHICLENGEPILTSLVVLKETGRCSTGMEREFGVNEDEERAQVFRHWGNEPVDRNGADWTDEELQASIFSYAEMMRLDATGRPFVKAQYYRALAQRFNRVEGAFERRMQNISHLLGVRGLDWLQGLKPQENIGLKVEPRLVGFLEDLFTELTPPLTFPDDVSDLKGVIEGAKKQITVNAYERDPTAKPRCIKRWGTVCCVCDFNFGAVYGDLGAGFIHVHHLNPIHTIGEQYELDPENDLRPVCPNCHAMLHRRKETLSIQELKALLKLKFAEAYLA